MTDVAILGSGMAGIGASYRLRQQGVPHACYDQSERPGGHTRSHADAQGFTFDEGPHISFSKDERVKAVLAESVNGDYVAFSARVNNYWKGQWIKHPAQCNLHGLPTDLVVKIIEDMYASRAESHTPTNYEEWLVASFGRTFAETFPMRYGHKYHTVEAKLMSLDWLGPRLYKPSMTEVLTGALTAATPEVHYIQDFRYPTHGGFESYLKSFHAAMTIHRSHRLDLLDPKARVMTFSTGETVPYERLISSIPLPELIKRIPSAPPDVVAAAAKLTCSICVAVNVGLDRADISDWHWTYFYDDDFIFSRLSFPHMFAPANAPAGMGSIQAEVYFSDKYKPLTETPEQVTSHVVNDLRRCGLIRDTDRIVTSSAFVIPYANVIFDLDRAPALELVQGYLESVGIQSCGRYGEWGYLWTDESFMSGERAADRALATTPTGV